MPIIVDIVIKGSAFLSTECWSSDFIDSLDDARLLSDPSLLFRDLSRILLLIALEMLRVLIPRDCWRVGYLRTSSSS